MLLDEKCAPLEESATRKGQMEEGAAPAAGGKGPVGRRTEESQGADNAGCKSVSASLTLVDE